MGEIAAIWGCSSAHHQKYKQSMRDSISSFFTGFDLDRSRRSKPGKFVSWLRTISLSIAHWTVRRTGTSSRSLAAATQLQSVLSTPVVRDGLRNYLAKRCGSENVDFLIGYWAFMTLVEARDPADECFDLTASQARSIIGFIGHRKAVDLGIITTTAEN